MADQDLVRSFPLLPIVDLFLIQFYSRYFSPYPLTESEAEETASSRDPSSSTPAPKIPGVTRTTIRSHGRTSELLAGGLARWHGSGEKATLWVCDRCFKYMADGLPWELHTVRPLSPPL
jgi:hypothetical protein